MKAELIRSANQYETPGALYVIDNGATIFKCDSLELLYRDNKKAVSCINTGIYLCKKREATKNIPYKHILITNVTGRSGICIHYGNFAAGKKVDIKGCVLVGSGLTDINGDGFIDIVNSKKTFLKLMAIVPYEFYLTIK